jgi:hypothetical protein
MKRTVKFGCLLSFMLISTCGREAPTPKPEAQKRVKPLATGTVQSSKPDISTTTTAPKKGHGHPADLTASPYEDTTPGPIGMHLDLWDVNLAPCKLLEPIEVGAHKSASTFDPKEKLYSRFEAAVIAAGITHYDEKQRTLRARALNWRIKPQDIQRRALQEASIYLADFGAVRVCDPDERTLASYDPAEH